LDSFAQKTPPFMIFNQKINNMKTLFSSLKRVTFMAILIVFALAIMSLCITPPEEGNWINRDSETSGITRVEVQFVCQDVIVNGEPYPPGPPFYVHLWGSCTPSDCDWGQVGANPVTIGTTDWIYAFYDQGFARRYVYIKPSALYPDNLFMWIYTDFTSPSRPDYVSRHWFRQ
jgi:hypothetical protein